MYTTVYTFVEIPKPMIYTSPVAPSASPIYNTPTLSRYCLCFPATRALFQ